MPVARLFLVARERLRAVFRKDTLDAELERELAFHFDHLVQEFIDDGLSPDEARHAARRALGNRTSLEEECRDQRAVTWIHDLHRDATYGIRMLRKHPAFTAVAVVSLAIGIGANTAILSVMHAVLRERLPIPDDEHLVVLRTFQIDTPAQESHALVTDYFAWRDENRSFDRMGVAMGHNANFGSDPEGPRAERIGGQLVTSELLSLLGVEPLLGRLFTEEEGRPGAMDRVVIISHRLWQRRYGARPDILGQVVRLDRVPWTIVGVMPEGFKYPNESADYWIPLRMDRSRQRSPQRFFIVTARLKAGVTPEQAQSDVEIISARLAREDPDRHAGWGVRVRSLRETMYGWTVAPLFTLEAAVSLVLLVVCANLAGLLLARGLVRMPELALRTALGARRGRIVRQLLTESILLSLVGGALGVLVAWGGIRALMALNPPPGSVGIVDVQLEPLTLAITTLISVAAGTIFGLVPALIGANSRVTVALKEATSVGSRVPHFRGGLVAVQIAVTFVLLIGSGLLMKSFVQLMSRDLRFDPQRLLTFEYHMPLSDYVQQRGLYDGLPYFQIDPPPSLTLERIRSTLLTLAGVETVAGTSFPMMGSVVLPSVAVNIDTLSGDGTSRLHTPLPSLAIGVGSREDHLSDREALSAAYFLVTPDFFTSIKAQLVDGRDFSESDTGASRWVVIVNESAARRFWPGQRAVGRGLRLSSVPDERPREVIAVVRDIPLTRQGDLRPVIYASYLQQPSNHPQPGVAMFGQMTFMVRTAGDPLSLLPAARRAIAQIDPDRPLSNVGTMEQQLGRVVPQRGYFAFAVTVFALVAMLLAGIGIYGVVSYSVAERTREIGIRIALGASRREVIQLVAGRALFVIALGLSVGLAGALMLTQLLQSQLWGVTPTDRSTFAAAIAVLVAAAVAACVFPLRRALGVNPTVALRYE